jgi:hypothetical protein
MKKLLIIFLIPISFTFGMNLEQDMKEDNNSQGSTLNPSGGKNNVYYGGGIGFNFWNNYFYLSIQPMVAYKVTPQFSVGGRLVYTYISDDRSSLGNVKSNNYGASLFTRYRIIPQLYAHAEFAYASTERHTYNIVQQQFSSERVWVPYLLLGGGYSQQISPNAWAYAEVLFDVIQDKNSVYGNWDPIVSVGVGVGF